MCTINLTWLVCVSERKREGERERGREGMREGEGEGHWEMEVKGGRGRESCELEGWKEVFLFLFFFNLI